MYLSATTDKIQVVLSGTVTTNQLQCVASYQDVTSAGMTLPQLSNQALTNNATAVDLVGAAAASTTRQVTHINIYNSDTVAATVTVQKDVSGTDYLLTKALLQVGSTLQWSRESGWNILSNSLQESVIITEFTANGTWTKPQGMKRAMIVCIGAGGGGGSGRCDAAGTNRFGGGGGGGAAVVWHNLAAADLTATVAVTIGTGGTGGTGVNTVATSGNAGTAGGDTSFGTIVIAKGGGGGGGGTGAAGSSGQGGQSGLCAPIYQPYSLSGQGAGPGQSGNGSGGSTGFSGNGGAAGGGGGGGINSGNTNATSGGIGGGVYSNGLLVSGPTSGATPNGVANQSNFLFFSNSLTSGKGLGTGGAGGYPSLPADAGNGGNYGAGGGGGRASLTGTLSGAGGNGGAGLCLVMEIY
jgi:hypothetical protein